MTLRDCINRAVTGGEMDPARAERVVSMYEAQFQEFTRTMGPTQAEYQAARVIIDKVKAEAAEKRRVHQLQAAATRRNLERMEAHRDIRGNRSPGDFVQDLISRKRGGGGQTLTGAYEAVRRSFRRDMTEAIRTFSANLVGVRRNKETLKNVAREVFGESTGDELAASIAKAWTQVSERARTRFNAAGGHIGKRGDWGMPQSHDTRKARKAGYSAWRAEILPRLDLEAMGRDFNNGIPFTDETIEVLLNDAYKAISTDGYSRQSAAATYGSAMYNRRADHRFFKFKSADDWMAYSDRFGTGRDPFRVMLAHLDAMAMDISLMEQLGPNPTHGYQFLKDAARRVAALSGDEKAIDKVESRLEGADAMFDLHTGTSSIPGNKAFAQGASAVRQYLTSAQLGSAIISSVTDFNTQRVAAGFLGMRRFGFMRQMSRLVRDPEFRAEANQAGLIFENAVDMGNAAARYNLEELHIESAARLADFTIRASGLGHLTELQRQSFGLEFMSQAARSLEDPRMARALEDYGITARDRQILAGIPRHKMRNGLEILRAQEIEEAGHQALADLYIEAVTSLTEFAVPSTDLYGRAQILGRAKAGTIAGEFIRGALQYKAFPITVLTTQVSRVMNEAMRGRKLTAMSYAANVFIGATILGGLAIQMKEASKGRDPRDMTTGKFWMAAAAQGGGLGLFGDFLFSDVNRFGQGMGQSLVGPQIGLADDVLRLTVGNLQELAMGEETNAGRELTNFMRRYTPGGSIWYLRLAYEREILDQLQTILDPDFRESFRARERSARQFDTEFFAPPGESLFGRGVRAPDFGAALGD